MTPVDGHIQKIYEEIEDLVFETFELWDNDRVGFRWKHYLPNHTKRVHAACLELGKREGASLLELSFASTLHDITKAYDGEIYTDSNGNRILDENGFWKNEVLLPARQNKVTRLYDSNNLYGTMHHLSGAFIARTLLEEYGLEQSFVDNVSAIIAAHVKPRNLPAEEYNRIYSKIESQIIYDADTIDANLGFVAFFRNIHIHAPRYKKNGGFDMGNYINSIEPWINRKQDFADGLFTRTARKIGEERQQRKRYLYQQLVSEQQDPALNSKYGMMGILNYFVEQTDEPDFGKQLGYLQQRWIPERKKLLEHDRSSHNHEMAMKSLEHSVDFCTILSEEALGIK
jgi:HD superfamily phosphodiesterase